MSTLFERKLMDENRSIRERNAELRKENAHFKRQNAELKKSLGPFAALSLPEDQGLGGKRTSDIKEEWIRHARQCLTSTTKNQD